MRIPVRSGRSDRRAAGKGFLPSEMTALAFREGCEVVHTEVPPCRCRLEDPSLNGDPDLTRPRTEGRRDGLEHSGFEGALRLSGLVFRFRLLRSGLGAGGAPVWVSPSPHPACPAASHGRGPSPGSSGAGPHHLLRQWPPLEVRGGPPRSAPPLPPGPPSWPLLGDGGGVEPGLNLEGLHRRRVEGSAFLALFLVAWQWGPLPRRGRQKLLVQLHGAVPDHRPDEEGTKSEKLAWSGFSQAIGSVASSLTSTEALSLRSRARSVSGPSAPADRAAVQTALPWSSTVNCQCVPTISRVAELVAVSMGSVFLPHPMHFVAPFFTQGMVQQGQIQDVGSLPRGGSPGPRTPSQRACQPAVPGC